MPRLRQRMRDRHRNWRRRLEDAWRPLVDDLDPAHDGIDAAITIGARERIYPADPFRAFADLPPDQVRVVVLGEDPFPDLDHATGRAFEVRDQADWAGVGHINSSRRLAQQLADFHRPGRNYAHPSDGWDLVKTALRRAPPTLVLPAPADTFDRWQTQGVLLLNTVLTASENHIARGDDQRARHRTAHRLFWAPVVAGICLGLAQLDQPTVFLCWGVSARNFVRDAGVITSTACPFPVAASCPRTKVLVRDHPATARTSFLETPNVFREANEALAAFGGPEIRW